MMSKPSISTGRDQARERTTTMSSVRSRSVRSPKTKRNAVALQNRARRRTSVRGKERRRGRARATLAETVITSTHRIPSLRRHPAASPTQSLSPRGTHAGKRRTVVERGILTTSNRGEGKIPLAPSTWKTDRTRRKRTSLLQETTLSVPEEVQGSIRSLYAALHPSASLQKTRWSTSSVARAVRLSWCGEGLESLGLPHVSQRRNSHAASRQSASRPAVKESAPADQVTTTVTCRARHLHSTTPNRHRSRYTFPESPCLIPGRYRILAAPTLCRSPKTRRKSDRHQCVVPRRCPLKSTQDANANRPESPQRRQVSEGLRISTACPLLAQPRSLPFLKNMLEPTRMTTKSLHLMATALKFTNHRQPREAGKSHAPPRHSKQSESKKIAAAHHPRVTLRHRHARLCSRREPQATSTAHRACRTSQRPDPASTVTRASARPLLNCSARSRPLPHAPRLVRPATNTLPRETIHVISVSCRKRDRGPGTTLPAATAKRLGRLTLATPATPLRRLIRAATAGPSTLLGGMHSHAHEFLGRGVLWCLFFLSCFLLLCIDAAFLGTRDWEHVDTPNGTRDISGVLVQGRSRRGQRCWHAHSRKAGVIEPT